MTDPTTQAAVERLTRLVGTYRNIDAHPLADDLTTLLSALANQAERIKELEANLAVIGKAAERSQRLFGGPMSEVTKVFEHITRVARLPSGTVKVGAEQPGQESALAGFMVTKWGVEPQEAKERAREILDALFPGQPAAPSLPADVERLVMALSHFMPITTHDTPDYAAVTFGDHQSQAMTMDPAAWNALTEAYAPFADRGAGEEQ